MEDLSGFYYECGMKFFELEKYEEAVVNWIRAYDSGYERENILENIYNCFILPNQGEFRENYDGNSNGVTSLPFESCTLDFIPVSEEKFYIFDQEDKSFHGSILLEKEPVQGGKIAFDNILYTDTWDIRKMLFDMKENRRDVIYVLLNQLESKFVSFCKLPAFRELYLRNVIVFKNEELMCKFFEEYEEFYIPKQIITMNAEKYRKLLMESHEKRIRNIGTERKNVFLSICIPSYNRGKLALENVKHLLSLPYDSEIEIVVSNNGSENETEYYDEIKNISDSRIRYHEFSENQCFAVNVLKVCELARGKYAMMASDEDVMILENLAEYLNRIKKYSHFGTFSCTVYDNYLWSEDALGEAGAFAVAVVSTWSYLTGLTFNMELFHELKVLDICRRALNEDENGDVVSSRPLFLEMFIHDAIMSILSYHSGEATIALPLWDAKINAPFIGNRFSFYFTPETRISNQKSFMDFFYKTVKPNKTEFISMFEIKCRQTHNLLKLSYDTMPDDMLNECGAEWETQAWIYREQMKYLDSFPFPITESEYNEIRKQISMSIR